MHVQGQPFVSYAADAVVVRVSDRLDGLRLLGGRADCQPGNGGLMVTPEAPHSAYNRGVVISARELVVLEILPASGRLAVEVDGVVAGYASPSERIGPAGCGAGGPPRSHYVLPACSAQAAPHRLRRDPGGLARPGGGDDGSRAGRA